MYKSIFEQVNRYDTILEDTLNLNKDVLYIYNKMFRSFIINLRKQQINKNIKDLLKQKNDILFGIVNSNELNSSSCKKSNLVSPILIYCGIFKDSENSTDYNNKKMMLSLNYEAINLLRISDFNLEVANHLLSKSNFKTLDLEINGTRIKSSIYHELSHWVRDALHNRYGS